MRKIIKDNKVFFLGFAGYLLLAVVILSATRQGDCIRYFSQNRSAGQDLFFSLFTRLGEIEIYLGLILVFLFLRFRYSLLVFSTGILVILISLPTKSLFGHLRPAIFFRQTSELDQMDLVEGIQLYTGSTSFPSGHTISAFALYGLLAFLITRQKNLAGGILLLVAVFIAVSRIYLVQHFLKDVFAGSIIGVLIAMTIYYIHTQFPFSNDHFTDRSLLRLPKKTAGGGK